VLGVGLKTIQLNVTAASQLLQLCIDLGQAGATINIGLTLTEQI
jgi:hypothetical protein